MSEINIDDAIQDITAQLKDLQNKVDSVSINRVFQNDIVNNEVKMRHMGEGNRYIQVGLDAKRPTGVTTIASASCYFATDTNKLYIWNGTAWKSVTLS